MILDIAHYETTTMIYQVYVMIVPFAEIYSFIRLTKHDAWENNVRTSIDNISARENATFTDWNLKFVDRDTTRPASDQHTVFGDFNNCSRG